MNVMRCVIIVEGLETNQTVSALVILEVQLTAGEERWTLCVSVYIHHYSPPLPGIVLYCYHLGEH